MNLNSSKTILFITGAFVSNACWKDWQNYFESNGYKTSAPPWPHKDAPAEELRNKQPDALIASNRLTTLVDHYTAIINKLDEKPIIIGHSIGGLLVQLLLQKDLAVAGVAIHSVPPQGVMTFKFSFLKAGWGALGFFTSVKKSYLMSFKQWQYAFTNGMTCNEQKEAYYRLCIPESKLVVRDTITKVAHIDFTKPHEPLLFISGSIDHAIPASLNYSNFSKYKNEQSVTDYKEFPGRNHYVLDQPGWKELADFILQWLQK